jgi:hypothetical protein
VVATSRRPVWLHAGRQERARATAEHAGPGGCLPHAPRVSPSSPPDTPATLFHPYAGHTTAWPHGSASQKTSRSPRPGGDRRLGVGPAALVPFLPLVPWPPSSSPFSSLLAQSKKQTAEPSPRILPRRVASPCPVLERTRSGVVFGKVRNSPPCLFFFCFGALASVLVDERAAGLVCG